MVSVGFRKILHLVGRLGSGVRISAGFQMFSRGNLPGWGISPGFFVDSIYFGCLSVRHVRLLC